MAVGNLLATLRLAVFSSDGPLDGLSVAVQKMDIARHILVKRVLVSLRLQLPNVNCNNATRRRNKQQASVPNIRAQTKAQQVQPVILNRPRDITQQLEPLAKPVRLLVHVVVPLLVVVEQAEQPVVAEREESRYVVGVIERRGARRALLERQHAVDREAVVAVEERLADGPLVHDDHFTAARRAHNQRIRVVAPVQPRVVRDVVTVDDVVEVLDGVEGLEILPCTCVSKGAHIQCEQREKAV